MLMLSVISLGRARTDGFYISALLLGIFSRTLTRGGRFCSTVSCRTTHFARCLTRLLLPNFVKHMMITLFNRYLIKLTNNLTIYHDDNKTSSLYIRASEYHNES